VAKLTTILYTALYENATVHFNMQLLNDLHWFNERWILHKYVTSLGSSSKEHVTWISAVYCGGYNTVLLSMSRYDSYHVIELCTAAGNRQKPIPFFHGLSFRRNAAFINSECFPRVVCYSVYQVVRVYSVSQKSSPQTFLRFFHL